MEALLAEINSGDWIKSYRSKDKDFYSLGYF